LAADPFKVSKSQQLPSALITFSLILEVLEMEVRMLIRLMKRKTRYPVSG
jgi:hypothetical protein